MSKVYVQNTRHPALARILREHGHEVVEGPPGPVLDLALLSTCDGLYLNPPARADAELLSAAPGLAVIGVGGAGADHVDVEVAASRGITVVDGRGLGATTVAEYVIGSLIASTRRLTFMQDRLRARDFSSRWEYIGNEISGKTLGIVGYGHIGTELARLAAAFKMRVVRVSRSGSDDVQHDLLDVFGAADFVSIHLPLTEQTRGLIDRKVLSAAKPGLHLVNTSRGGVVDESALADYIRVGRIAGAVIDVFADEPQPWRSPLAGMDVVIATPHCAGITHESLERLAVGVAGRMAEALAATVPTANVPETRSI